jgi:thioredoxin reductase (NADPH)
MYDVIIIGSGPAGLTAAIYATRANLKTLIIAGTKWGGQLMLTTEVENFPGFPDGIMGPELMNNMRKQAEKFGTEIVDVDYAQGDLTIPNGPFKITAGDKQYEGKSVILATGADTKWLGVTGEAERIGHGVSSCAPCDAFFFKNKNVIVVGGGDSAMEEALVLTKFATEVTVIHRNEELKASEIMQKRAKENPKIKFLFNCELKEIKGEGHVEAVTVFNNKTNESSDMPIDGVFVAIGHMPNTKTLKGIELDEKGYIVVHEHARTNVEGVFTAGDVHDYHFRQAVTAAGFGCMAALEVERYLDGIEEASKN